MRRVRLLSIVLCVMLNLVMIGLGAAEERPAERVSPPPEINSNAAVWRTPEPPKEAQAGDVWVNPKDGMEMVYIPPGEFILGTSDEEIDAWLKEHPADKRELFEDEQPQCRVKLPGYWIGRVEVTNAQYRRFVQDTGHRAPRHWKDGQVPSGLESFPVMYVSWDDARAYCEWAGDRLPSELEWEKAAQGTDGRVFPWGNQWDRKRCRNLQLITGETDEDPSHLASAFAEWERSHDPVREGPVAVGFYPAGASPYGCVDMAGNVWEWCEDWQDAGAYKRYAKGDLKPPASGTYRVLRGGCWFDGLPTVFRCANRDLRHPDPRNYFLFFGYGFRCARDAP